MARSVLAHAGTVAVFALTTLAACDRGVPTEASFARTSSNGNGKGPSTTAELPKVTISPTQMSLTVGQQGTVTVTFYDKQGNAIPVTDGTGAFFGCRKLVKHKS